ncbi:MAG: diguanylate cyclase [Phycisphaeraceae bacterium]|nr:diguanylate cyclase [Phycisphaeraceae bacterium]
MTEDVFKPSVPKLLVIDDSELIHRLLRVRLQHERIEIHSAMSAMEGLRMARLLRPEVILLDIEMDEMDGFEVLSRLKSDPETQQIAVIFISATSDTMDRVRGLDLGAVDFICKPFEVVELKARVRSALRMQHLVFMLEQKAQIDGLSGLWNRRYFEQRLQQEVSEAIRHKQPLALLMCDLDRFKRINDQYGHPFGDSVIERMAQILSSGRTSDIPCRYGGEEFGVILPNTGLDEAAEVAERHRAAMEAQVWSINPELVVTSSFGVCDLESVKGPQTAETLVACADAALYRAKERGRNCVHLFGREGAQRRSSESGSPPR